MNPYHHPRSYCHLAALKDGKCPVCGEAKVEGYCEPCNNGGLCPQMAAVAKRIRDDLPTTRQVDEELLNVVQ